MAAATATQIHQLYIAYFGRVADPAGISYWTSTGASVEDIAKAFGDKNQAETAGTYDLIKFPELVAYADQRGTFIDGVYNNLFGRAADTAGKAYWDTQLKTGAVSVSQFLLAVINGALGDDAAIIANKVAVSTSFVSQATAAGTVLPSASLASGVPVYASALKAVLTGVGANAATVQIGDAQAASTVASVGTSGVIDLDSLLANGVYGATATTIASTNGSAGNDLFQIATPANLDAAAKIDAGAGTDTLVLKGAITSAEAAQFYNFEALKLATATVTTTDFTNSKIASVTVDKALAAATINSATALTVNTDKAMAADTTLTLNAADSNGKFGVVAATSVNGDSVLVNAAGTNGHTLTLTNGLAANGNDFSNLLLSNTGADGKFAVGTFTTVTLSGDHAADLGTLNTATKVLAGSTYTGNVTVTAGGVGSQLTSLTTGSGNDKITVADTTGVNLTVTAGDGNDVITVTDAATTGTIKLFGGAGADAFTFTAASKGSANVTVADFATGDSLIVNGLTSVAHYTTAFASTVTTAAQAAAVAVSGVTVAGQTAWFQFGGDTYVAETHGAAGYVDGTDLLIKVTGTVDLTNAIHAA